MGKEALTQHIPEKSWKGQITEEPTMFPLDLDQEIQASGLTLEEVTLLRSHSAGVLTLYDFASMWMDSENSQNREDKGGYSLGITNDRSLYQSASIAYDLYPWMEGYNLYNIPRIKGQEDPSIYLEAITNSEKPIVFFVPRDIHSDIGNVTRDELQWFLRNAENGKAKNTYFVFGLHSVIDDETYLSKIPMAQDPRQKKMEDMFKNPKKYISE